MRLALRRGEVLVGGSFALAALALVLAEDVGHIAPVTAAVYVMGIALAVNVRFDVGAGFTVPTQALFVPLLFAVPVATVPILVPLALALGMIPRIVRREVAPSWLLTALGNSWFALGPVATLLVFDVHSASGHAGVLLLAFLAQIVCDLAASVVRDRLHGDLEVRELIEEVRPIYTVDLALSALGLAAALAASSSHSQLSVLLVVPMFGVLRFFSRERQERLEQLVELNDAYQGTALLLGDVVEADDSYTGEHCKSVVRLSLEVAGELGLGDDMRRNVEFGALLHDVGKIAVPDEIINKPGKLDEHEWAIIRTHTIEGQMMLDKIGGFMREIGGIVRASHERWDGGGYPDGLRGEEIPRESRIVCACDAFNAMTTTRSYRKAMGTPEAVAEMLRCSGTQFDPVVVEALVRVSTRNTAERQRGAQLRRDAGGEHHGGSPDTTVEAALSLLPRLEDRQPVPRIASYAAHAGERERQ
jgi:putative nucleotidyltransferase with HDIG domain